MTLRFLPPTYYAVLWAMVFLSAGQAAPPEAISLAKCRSSADDTAVTVQADGSLRVDLSAGAKGMPGGIITPEVGEVWDLSAFSRIEATIRNPSEYSIPVSLRVDNAGHWKEAPWSVESIRIGPGETRTLVVFFGFSNGMKPSNDIERSRIQQLLFFAPGAENARSFVVETVRAAGDPSETPAQWKASANQLSANGVLFGESNPLVSAHQLSATSDARFTHSKDGRSLHVTLKAADQTARFVPVSGTWNLRSANHVKVSFRNTGSNAIRPGVQIESRQGSTRIATTPQPVPPGEVTSILVPFAASYPWRADTPEDAGSAPYFGSNAVTAITFQSGQNSSDQAFEITQIAATAPLWKPSSGPADQPPVVGDWIPTLQEEFEAPALDDSIWNVQTKNHWDKQSGFSRDNVILADGLATLRFEHRSSHHNDDPNEPVKAYTTGFLDTFGKWTQTYGYFEARMKLPEAPGLWPAFWMMPDRGPSEAPRWKREQTTNQGMEFDIFEYLTGWGPYRYNVAFHWDGYGKNHLHAGTSGIYFQTDTEGFVTAGLLWLPGVAIYYCNGEEVGRWESDRISSVPSILMFTHVSGGWDNAPLENALLPADFVIDYVRCWQRRDLQ